MAAIGRKEPTRPEEPEEGGEPFESPRPMMRVKARTRVGDKEGPSRGQAVEIGSTETEEAGSGWRDAKGESWEARGEWGALGWGAQ